MTIWAGAAAVAGLGAWIMYDAFPGVNWVLWTTASVLGLSFILAGTNRRYGPLPAATAILAVVVAGAAALTADEFMHGVIFLSVTLLLALTMLLAVDPRLERISAWFVISAPILAAARAMLESLTRAIDASRIVRSHRARSAVRGIAITAPVILFFALLLSAADPVFAAWREAVVRLLSSWEFIPRTIFFFVLLAIVLGAYGYVARTKAGDTSDESTAGYADRTRWLGATERFILLASVGALFWAFLAVQLSYLFGNLPATVGSGVTFAEYARRGFGELTIVATSSVLLIMLSERYGQKSDRDGLLRAITLAVISAVLILLGSAFNRVSLYETAYGFTTARLYAQVYMFVIAVTLAVLAVETRREMDPSRVFRRAGLVALFAFVLMIYWNHESWIARENIQRFATTGKLDVVYLTRDLSPNAIPTIVAELPSLPDPVRSQLRAALGQRYEDRGKLMQRRWFEWNRGRAAARRELIRLGVSLEARVGPKLVPKPVPIATR
ncbi:MAG: DUF4173 domain-containing protein [Gemmatimonadaceae bacterium]